MTFTREMTAGASLAGTEVELVITPSMRRRTSSPTSAGSKWMSEAPSSTAWAMIEFTSLITGSSPADSARSATSTGSSSSGSSSTLPVKRSSRAISPWMSSRVATAGRTL